MILSNLNAEFYTMPIEPVTDMNVVINAELIAPYKPFLIAWQNLS